MLKVKNVVKDFDGLRALDGLSLEVEQGKIIGLIGPNGSGKSTLLSSIARTIDVTSGQILFDGHDLTHVGADAAFRLGLARGYQDPGLFFQMTVLDNVLLPAKDQRGEHPWYAPWKRFWKQQEHDNAGRAAETLKRVKLERHFDKPASDLSGGQMKLLEIARSLMGEPKLLLLDEPTAGVAPSLAYEIFQQIEALRTETGMTFLIVEHRLEILFDFVDSVYVMHMGKVLAHGTPDEIGRNAEVREVYLGIKAMDFQSKEWRDLQEEHLSLLTQYGIHFTAIIEGSADLLQRAFLGEIELAQDEQREIFAGLVNAAKEHSKLVRQSLRERQDFVDARRNRD